MLRKHELDMGKRPTIKMADRRKEPTDWVCVWTWAAVTAFVLGSLFLIIKLGNYVAMRWL